MRVIEGKTYGVYTLSELEARYPAAYEHAIDVLRDRVMADEFALDQTMGELMASLRGMAESSGVTLKDWSIGVYGYAHLSVTFPNEDWGDSAGDLTGQRALTWITNNLTAYYPVVPVTQREYPWERGGKRIECPFTGAWCDDTLTAGLVEAIESGDTLRGAWESLAGVMQQLLQDEDEYHASEAYLRDAFDCEEWFAIDGSMVGGE